MSASALQKLRAAVAAQVESMFRRSFDDTTRRAVIERMEPRRYFSLPVADDAAPMKIYNLSGIEVTQHLGGPYFPTVMNNEELAAFGQPVGTLGFVLRQFEYVYNNIEFEPYAGLMKGGKATLETKRGNDVDQAAALIELLKNHGGVSNPRFGYAYRDVNKNGGIEMPEEDVRRWLGVKDPAAAKAMLTATGMSGYDSEGDPLTYLDGDALRFDHTWVEADFDAGDGVVRTHRLDPSWKFKRITERMNYDDGESMLDLVPFDEVGYLSPVIEDGIEKVRDQLPIEYYQDQVASYLKTHRPDLSLEDLAYDGPIIRKRFIALPELPFSLPLPSGSETIVPENRRHRVQVNVYVGDSEGEDGVFVFQRDVAEVAQHPIRLTYTPDNKWLVWFNENESELGQTVPNGAKVTLIVGHINSGHVGDFADRTDRYKRDRGQNMTLVLDANQISARYLSRFQQLANDEANRITKGQPVDGSYVDWVPALAEMRHLYDLNEQQRLLDALTGTRTVHGRVGSGVATSSAVTTPAADSSSWNLPNPIYAPDTNLDNPNWSFDPVPLKGAWNLSAGSLLRRAVRLRGNNASALEHDALEKVINTDAVSTIKGLQWANTQPNHSIFEIWEQNDAPVYRLYGSAAAPQTFDWGQLSDLGGDLTGGTVKQIRDLVMDDDGFGDVGYTITIPNKKIHLPSDVGGIVWDGAVWIQERVDGGEFGYIISGASRIAGGYPHGNRQDDPTSNNPSNPVFSFTAGDPVNVSTGNMTHDEVDFSIPNIGFPLTFARHYDSLPDRSDNPAANRDKDRRLGVGWLHTYSDYLKLYTDTDTNTDYVTWFTGTGEAHIFEDLGNGLFKNPPGLFGTLSLVSGGHKYTERNGTERFFDEHQRLEWIRDRHGNGLNFSYDLDTTKLEHISDMRDNSRWIHLYYDAEMIDRVVDFTGREWEYDYTSFNDSEGTPRKYLTEVRGPVDTDRLISRYEYYGMPLSGETEAQHRSANLHRIGLMRSMTNVNTGGKSEFDYYANGRAFKVIDPDSVTNLEDPSLHDPREEYFWFDLSNQRTTHTNARGYDTTYVFNGTGLTTQVLNPDGSRRETVWGFDNAATWDDVLPSSETDEVGHTVNYQYYTTDGADGLKGNLLSQSQIINDDGGILTTSYKYDPSSHDQVKEIRVSGTGQPDRVTTSTFHPNGDVEKVELHVTATDPNETNVTSFTYYSHGLVQTKTRPRGYGLGGNLYTTDYTYNAAGQVIIERNRLMKDDVVSDIDATYVYDNRGNLTSATDPTARSVLHTYDEYGRMLTTTIPDPDGITNPALVDQTTRNVYANGRLAYTEDPRGVITETDPTDFLTQFEYDKNGRVTKVINPDGSFTTADYNAIGNPVRSTDELGREAQTFYDSRNRPVQTLYDDGGFMLTTYDGVGRVLETAEPKDHVTPYGLDDVYLTTLQYDLGSRLKFASDAEGQIMTYSYFPFGETRQESFYVDLAAYNGNTAWRTTLTERDILGRPTITRSDTRMISKTLYDKDGNVEYQYTYDVPATADPLTVNPDALPFRETRMFYDSLGRLGVVQDHQNNKTRYSYDDAGRVRKVQDPRGELTPDENDFVTQYTYDMAGRLSHVSTPRVEYWDGAAFVTKPHGDTVYTYDQAGNPFEVIDPEGKTTKTVYDNRNRLVQTLDANQNDANITYYATGEVFTTSDELDRVTTYKYDDRGRLIETILPDPAGGSDVITLTNVYDAAGNLIRSTDATGSETWFHYDGLDRVRETRLGVHTLDNSTLTETEDGSIARVQVLNHRLQTGDTVQVEGAAADRAMYNGTFTITVVDANTFTYPLASNPPGPPNGNPHVHVPTMYDDYEHNDLTRHRNSRELGTETEYDNAGRTIRESAFTTPGDYESTQLLAEYTYDAFGNLLELKRRVSEMPLKSDVTTYKYDTLHRKIEEVRPDPDGAGPKKPSTTRYLYDAVGNVTAVIDPLGNETFNPTGWTDEQLRGQLQSMANSNSHTTTYRYDSLNRKIEEKMADPSLTLVPPTTHFEYDGNGNVIKRTDPIQRSNGAASRNVTEYAYDNLNRLFSETTVAYLDESLPAETVVRTHTYDAVGNPDVYTNRNGATVNYDFDRLDRLKSEVWSDGRVINYSYDDAGRLLSAGDASGSYVYKYNEIGELVETQISNSPGFPATTLKHAYDANGNRRSLNVNIGGAVYTNAYTLDLLDRPTSIAQSGGGVDPKTVELRYNLLGQYTELLRRIGLGSGLPSVSDSVYTYDDASRLTSLTHSNSLGTYAFNHDANGRITTFTVNGSARYYAYDANDQLTSDAGQTHTYDENGNRTGGGSNLVGDDNRIIFDGTHEYTYDREGNIRSRANFKLTQSSFLPTGTGQVVSFYRYDAANRLIELDTITQSEDTRTIQRADFGYDVDDRRISKAVTREGYFFEPEGSDGGTFEESGGYTYAESDGFTFEQSDGYTFEDTGGYVPEGDGSEEFTYESRDEKYAYDGPDMLAMFTPEGRHNLLNGPEMDQVLADDTSGIDNKVHWNVADHQGSVRLVRSVLNSGTTGVTTKQYDYDAFGNLIPAETSETWELPPLQTTRFLYTGQQYDETGLYYYGARYYDPKAGRFITQDPIGFAGGQANLFVYVGNNPVNMIDPTGLGAMGLGSYIGMGIGSVFGGAGASVGRLLGGAIGGLFETPNAAPPLTQLADAGTDGQHLANFPPHLHRSIRLREHARSLGVPENAEAAAHQRALQAEADAAGRALYATADVEAGGYDPKLGRFWHERGFSDPIRGAANQRLGNIDTWATNTSSPTVARATGLYTGGMRAIVEIVTDPVEILTTFIPGGRGVKGAINAGEAIVDTSRNIRRTTIDLVESGVRRADDAGLGDGVRVRDLPGVGAYKKVKGHHLHQKVGLEGQPNYSGRNAISISRDLMKKLGIRHVDVTAAQRRLFDAAARALRSNTLKLHTRIAVRALVAGGAGRQLARDLVAESLRQLRNSGVRTTMKLPWN